MGVKRESPKVIICARSMSKRLLKIFTEGFPLHDWDWVLATSLVVLYAMGLVATLSISQGGSEGRALRQFGYVMVGVLLVLGMVRLETHRLRTTAFIAYLVTVVMLALVLVIGTDIRGTKSWFAIGAFTLQPVEFMKLSLILMLAGYYERSRFRNDPWTRFLVSGIITAVPVGLVLMQPDAGSALILTLIWLAMAATQLDVRRIMLLIAVACAAGLVMWFFLLEGYQQERIRVLINPNLDPYGVGYNTRQSVIAIGSGLLFGRGIGAGSQGHLRFLPEAVTDFPFAVLAEELGLMGALVVFSAFAVLCARMLHIAREAREDFSSLLTYGVSAWFFLQAFVNIGMNLGILPVIGVPLPFISYGGSSLIAASLAAGVVIGVRTVRRND